MNRSGSQPEEAVEGRIWSWRWGGRVRILESWFDDDPPSRKGADIWISHQRSKPLSRWCWHYRYTLFIDLTQSAEALMEDLNRTTAREVRKAETKDGFTVHFNPSPTDEDIQVFADAFDASPNTPDQPPMERDRLWELHRAGFLHLSQVRNAAGEIVVWHGVLRHRRCGIAQPYYQVSVYHQATDSATAGAIGRANRWLYYREFLYFKEQGFQVYDLNGWYTGIEDEKRLKINQFKEGFGGRGRLGYDNEQPVTLKGWFYFIFKTLKRWVLLREQARELARLRKPPVRVPGSAL
jgi:hypothetical protein